jgi:plasmid maintenance system killer protein
VELEFATDILDLVETGKSAGSALPVEVLRSVRHRLTMIRAAPDLATLASWKSFGLVQDEPNSEIRSVQINDNWKLAVRFECEHASNRATVLGVNSNR